MKVMGLDLSLSQTGVALPGRVVTHFSPKKVQGPARLVLIRDALGLMLDDARIGCVYLEGYSFASFAGRERLGELGGVVRAMLWERQLPYLEIPPTTLKMFATGHGNAKKPEVIASARERLGYTGFNDNEADALWLWAMGMTHYGEPPVELPKTHLRALAKLSKLPQTC